MDDSILLPTGLDGNSVSRLYRCVRDDNPLLFCCDNGYILEHGSFGLKLIPRYRMKRREYTLELNAVRHAAEAFIAPAGGPACEIEKIKLIHDWFLANCRYGRGELRDSHELTGPLLRGTAVCEGISRAFKYLCDLVAIPSLFVSGTVDSENNTEAISSRHAWNIVTLPLRSGSHRSFHIDVTFACRTMRSRLIMLQTAQRLRLAQARSLIIAPLGYLRKAGHRWRE